MGGPRLVLRRSVKTTIKLDDDGCGVGGGDDDNYLPISSIGHCYDNNHQPTDSRHRGQARHGRARQGGVCCVNEDA